MTEQVWRVAGRYRVLGRIGSGGMADVLRAHDELLDRDVAVKVFRSVPTTPDTASGVERQQAELRALARLNHPNLTVLYDGSIVGQDGPAYLVMELISGGSLAEAIADGGLGVEHTAEVGAQVADALAYVHSAGMVHRDVKPANVLLGADRIADTDFGRARLTDFGIVRLIGDEPLTQADMTLGSASYLAPEQTRGSGVGPPADIYALGLSLLEALTGRRSFEGPPIEAAMARLTHDPYVPGDLPQPWPGLLTAMTARDPAVRPTAAQVAKTLRNTDTTAAAITALPVPVPVPFPDASGDTTAYLPRGAAAGSTTALPPTARPPVGPPPPVRVARPADVPPPPPRRIPVWVAVLAGVVVLALIIGGILLAVSNSGNSGGGGPTTSAPNTPATTAPAPSAPTTRATTTAPTTAQAPSTEDTPSAPSSEPPSSDTPTPSSEPPSSPSTSASSSPSRSTSAASSTAASRTASSSPTTSAAAEGPALTPPPATSSTGP